MRPPIEILRVVSQAERNVNYQDPDTVMHHLRLCLLSENTQWTSRNLLNEGDFY
jgi:hypothetical protein